MVLCFTTRILCNTRELLEPPGALHHVMAMEIEQITALDKSPQTVKARSLLCFWAHRKPGMTTIEIGRRLNISQSAVSRSSMRGQNIENDNRFELIDNNA